MALQRWLRHQGCWPGKFWVFQIAAEPWLHNYHDQNPVCWSPRKNQTCLLHLLPALTDPESLTNLTLRCILLQSAIQACEEQPPCNSGMYPQLQPAAVQEHAFCADVILMTHNSTHMNKRSQLIVTALHATQPSSVTWPLR